MKDTVLIEALQRPITQNDHLQALQFILENEVSVDAKFLAAESLSTLHNEFNSMVLEKGLSECVIKDTDSISIIRSKCKIAYMSGIHSNPMMEVYGVDMGNADSGKVPEEVKTENLDYALPGFTGSFERKSLPIIKKSLTLGLADDESGVKRDEPEDQKDDYDPEKVVYPHSAEIYAQNEAKSSTERVRKYYRKHPEKVRKYLRDTVKDRSARNRDRAKAVKRHGKSKMKNHDVHHPNGPNGGSWRLAKKDHGPDKKNESVELNPMIQGIENFVQFAAQKLRLKEVPTVYIIPAVEGMTSLGHYNPDTKQLMVVVEGRLLADVLRTIAHEMTHIKQDELGMIKNPQIDGSTGSDIENDANSSAGILMRQYSGDHPEIFVSEELIMEGGAAGHMAHPYEDDELTFRDVKEMIHRGLIGSLDAEAPVTEKLDGQNIMFTIRNGQIVFARNKGQVKNKGQNALDVAGIRNMFAGRGHIEKAFTGAAEDLESAVSKLTPKQQKQLFAGGSKFMNVEVIFPDTKNVIPYDKSVLVFHGTVEYDKDGNELGRSIDDAHTLSSALTAVNADRQKTFGISGPRTIAFDDTETARNKKKMNEYVRRIQRLQDEYHLDDSSTIEDYKREWWSRAIDNMGLELSQEEKDGLVDRWAMGIKKFGPKDIQDPAIKKKLRDFEKNDLQNVQRRVSHVLERTFLQVGTDSMRRVSNFLAANNPQAAAQLKKEVLDTIKQLRQTNDRNKLAKLQTQVERLDALGIDNIVPSEGVVFIYNGKPYKFTGTFAPVNQILGTLKFDKGEAVETPEPEPKEEPKAEKQPKEKPKQSPTDLTLPPPKPSRTVAIFTGRFQPFHAGHYSIYEALVKKFGKDNVYIASSNVQDAIKSPFPFTDKKEIMSRMFGVPEDMIVQVKNPYAPKEILDKLPEDTAYVTAVSQKDADRLGANKKYFKDYDKTNPKKLKGYRDEGYYIVAPEMKLTINGKNISGTQLRAVMGDPNITERAKQEIFTKAYGKFDKKIFDKVVKVTTEAEEAKGLTQMHGKPKKAKKPTEKKAKKATVKKAPPKAMARAKSILKQKIENPKTGRKIYVATALSYDKSEPVRQSAEKLLKKAMTVREEVLTENTKSEKLKTYIYVRDYTDDELTNMVSAYFDDEEMKKLFPTLAESEEELVQQIKEAPEEVLGKDDLESLANCDSGEVMNSKNPLATIKKIVEDDKMDLRTTVAAFKSKEELPMPIVIKMTEGYYLLNGNIQLSTLAALKYTMPVKVLAYDSPMAVPSGIAPKTTQTAGGEESGTDKGKFKKILQMKINNPETGNLIKIDTAMDYDRNHPAHKIALNTIRQHMKGLSSRAGIPKHKRS